MKKAKQLALFDLPIPSHVMVVETGDLDLASDAGMEICVRRMLAVPLDRSILLDFLVGRKRGDPHASEEHAELHRLQALLNSQYHHKRFDFLGDHLAARLFRNSIRTKGYKPAALCDALWYRDA